MKAAMILSLFILLSACTDRKATSTSSSPEPVITVLEQPKDAIPPPPPAEADRSTPEKTTELIFKAAATGNFSLLNSICSADAENSALQICSMQNKAPLEQKTFMTTYRYGKVNGAIDMNGDPNEAKVPYAFGDMGGQNGTLQLVKQLDDLWYLKAF